MGQLIKNKIIYLIWEGFTYFLVRVLLILIYLFLQLPLTHLISSKEKFQSPISKNEKRIIEYKNVLTDTEGFPESMKLFYKGKKDDFVIFYDWNGHEVFYKYRRNKFDYDAEENVIPLLEGAAYEITGKFFGMFIYVKKGESKMSPIPSLITDLASLTIEEKKHKENIPVFILKSFKSLELNELIY